MYEWYLYTLLLIKDKTKASGGEIQKDLFVKTLNAEKPFWLYVYSMDKSSPPPLEVSNITIRT